MHGKLSAWRPRTSEGGEIIVHSKVSIIDDRLIRVGSTNLNNRSCGFDTECDVAVERPRPDPVIRGFRQRLIAHFLGCATEDYAGAEIASAGVAEAITAMNGAKRMSRLTDAPPGRWAWFIAEYQLGDPSSVADAWRPWRRKRLSELLRDEVQAALIEARGSTSKSNTSGR